MRARSYLVMLTIPDSGIDGAQRVPLGDALPRASKARDVGPAVSDQLPNDSARMEFSRTTGAPRSSPGGLLSAKPTG